LYYYFSDARHPCPRVGNNRARPLNHAPAASLGNARPSPNKMGIPRYCAIARKISTTNRCRAESLIGTLLMERVCLTPRLYRCRSGPLAVTHRVTWPSYKRNRRWNSWIRSLVDQELAFTHELIAIDPVHKQDTRR